MINTFSNNEIKEMQILHQEKRSPLIINFKNQITSDYSVLEKICYIVLNVVSLGFFGVNHRHAQYCKRLKNAILEPNSNDHPVTAGKIKDVIKAVFPENKAMQEKIATYEQNPGKATKREMKQEIQKLLSNGYSKNKELAEIVDIVASPRFAEARVALQRGVNPIVIHNGPGGITYKFLDRKNTKPLAVFKVCHPSAIDKETHVYKDLAAPSKIHVKETKKETLVIKGKKTEGMVQKFINGTTFDDWKTTNSQLIEQFQFITLFDLLNQNGDRNLENWMVDQNGKLWSIDHGQIESGHKYFPKYGLAITHQPVTENVKKHIQALDVETHFAEYCKNTHGRKEYAQRLIEFLQYAVQKGLNFYQINLVLSNTDLPSDKNFEAAIKKGLKQATDGSYYSLFFSKETSAKIRNHLEEKLWTVDELVEKHSRLQDKKEFTKEIEVEAILELNRQNVSFTLKKDANRKILESLAKQTKYKDSDEWKKFLDHLFPSKG